MPLILETWCDADRRNNALVMARVTGRETRYRMHGGTNRASMEWGKPLTIRRKNRLSDESRDTGILRHWNRVSAVWNGKIEYVYPCFHFYPPFINGIEFNVILVYVSLLLLIQKEWNLSYQDLYLKQGNCTGFLPHRIINSPENEIYHVKKRWAYIERGALF